jgi:hypothetical protein
MTDTSRPELTASEAAKATGVDRRTIGRRLKNDDFPNAHKVDGSWRIPVTDLLGAGLQVHAPTPPDTPPTPPDPDEVARLTAENAELRHRAEMAEAVAAERAEALADARLALRALTAGTPDTDTTSPARRPRWWRR